MRYVFDTNTCIYALKLQVRVVTVVTYNLGEFIRVPGLRQMLTVTGS